jgi:pimeloyl-ACP methyl ester carboxylesterase
MMKATIARRSLPAFLVSLALLPWRAGAVELWQTLPPTPAAVSGQSGYADVDGIRLYYVEIGSGPPVVLLHGGLANSDYFASQALALARSYRVLLVDSRGHGRSTRDGRPFGYDLMTDDVVALLDTLKIDKAAIVGWSDGAIIGLNLAMRYPRRVTRVFAFGANTSTSGVRDDFERNPTVVAFAARAGKEYSQLSPASWPYFMFQLQMNRMWKSEPNWSDEQLRAIRTPVWVVAGEHDEGITREHTDHIAATIPGARRVILPNVSHYAMLQDPAGFNNAILRFLGNPQAATPAPKGTAKKSTAEASKGAPKQAPQGAAKPAPKRAPKEGAAKQ